MTKRKSKNQTKGRVAKSLAEAVSGKSADTLEGDNKKTVQRAEAEVATVLQALISDDEKEAAAKEAIKKTEVLKHFSSVKYALNSHIAVSSKEKLIVFCVLAAADPEIALAYQKTLPKESTECSIWEDDRIHVEEAGAIGCLLLNPEEKFLCDTFRSLKIIWTSKNGGYRNCFSGARIKKATGTIIVNDPIILAADSFDINDEEELTKLVTIKTPSFGYAYESDVKKFFALYAEIAVATASYFIPMSIQIWIISALDSAFTHLSWVIASAVSMLLIYSWFVKGAGEGYLFAVAKTLFYVVDFLLVFCFGSRAAYVAILVCVFTPVAYFKYESIVDGKRASELKKAACLNVTSMLEELSAKPTTSITAVPSITVPAPEGESSSAGASTLTAEESKVAATKKTRGFRKSKPVPKAGIIPKASSASDPNEVNTGVPTSSTSWSGSAAF